MTARQKIIRAGIRNLKEFGYPDVDEKNILTDRIYSAFFLSMLEESPDITAVRELIAEIKPKP